MIFVYVFLVFIVLIGISIEIKLSKMTDQNNEIIEQLKQLNNKEK